MAAQDGLSFEGTFNNSITGEFKNNTTRDITPTKLRLLPTAIRESYLNRIDDVIDEDNMVSDSPDVVPTQQSVKAYTDSKISQEVIDRDAAIATALSGLNWKNAVIATTANITLSGEQTIDGVLTSGTRVLVKDQTTQTQNGVYVSAAGAWSRSTDLDTNAELQSAAVLIASGTVNGGSSWVQTQSAINIGSTNIIFQQIGASVPNATSSTRGIAKLYTSTGANTDGAMDQNSITNALAGKQGSDQDLTDIAALTPSNDDVLQRKSGAWTNRSLSQLRTDLAIKKVEHFACSNELSGLTTGLKITFRVSQAMTLTEVRISLTTAQVSGSIFTVDIKVSGATILSTLLTIDNNEKTSVTAATPCVISSASISDDAEVTVFVTQIGDGTATGLKGKLIGV